MSMKKWTDEELTSTRDKLEVWSSRYSNPKSGSRLWLLTAFLGAFAISTGFAFIIIDGVDILNIVLIVMGVITCFSWYKSEKQKKDNIAFLAEINKELKHREKRGSSDLKQKGDGAEKVTKGSKEPRTKTKQDVTEGEAQDAKNTSKATEEM
ncbi:MAG: hypothetical protein AAB306_01325 [Pseudomonadota bacterium]